MSAAASPGSEPARQVLVVEDERAMCDLISDILDDAGLRTLCARTDRDAYALLAEATRYSALVVDINLGAGTTGFDVARFARQFRQDLPVVYVTGQAAADSVKTFGVPGAVFVAKPFTAEDLVGELRNVIGEGED